MFSKSILAVAALASTLSVAAVAPAKADPSISFGIGFSSDPWGPGFGHGPFEPHHPPRPYGFGEAGFGYDGGPWDGGWHRPGYGYRMSCGQGVNVVRARGFRGVRPVDCSAPVYEYRGWKFGQPYSIQVSMRGRLLGASPTDW
jgi:opacity protein-like surface antigen